MEAKPSRLHDSLCAVLAALLFCLSACAPEPEGTAGQTRMPGPDRLWYRQPAVDWNEALPVGNGRLGAMVFGYPGREKLQLNEETLWAGSPVDNNNPAALEALPLIRRALFEGDYAQASALAEKSLLGTPPRIRSYQPLGDLLIDLEEVRAGAEYERDTRSPGRHRLRLLRDAGRRQDRAAGLLFGGGQRPGRRDRGRSRR